ncbi:hypothetical protein [Pseudomonas sp. RGM 3321]|uniref:hypothetical protein n=1 Tax=Pseudomonas sp. RGM 3321 TaxID=2930089 RepID=UPI001FCB0BB8|nr:hypothetical protein [Pseudomonas sp. RGM 3321]MCJ2373698.1 hypothetical protein [Pseudomonas sp. RGM 3321]
MMRTALTGLFLSAALLASPVFAADGLCGTNIQIIKDAQLSSGTNRSQEENKSLQTTQKNAEAAQAAGDEKQCVEITANVVNALKTTDSSSGGVK